MNLSLEVRLSCLCGDSATIRDANVFGNVSFISKYLPISADVLCHRNGRWEHSPWKTKTNVTQTRFCGLGSNNRNDNSGHFCSGVFRRQGRPHSALQDQTKKYT